MTYPTFVPPALPPQALPSRFADSPPRAARTQSIANKPFDTWTALLQRCPESNASKIESWLRKRFRFALTHEEARAIIVGTDVLKRAMPADFVRSVFGGASAPARAALARIESVFENTAQVQLVPADEGMMLKGRIVFSVIRPEAHGVVMTTTKLISTEPERLTTTRVDHVTADGLPQDLIDDLRAGATLS
jgi:hypothetical protein